MVEGSEPWVLVAGGFHQLGGMDKANSALAEFLLAQGHPVHLVAHQVASCLAAHSRVTVTRVDRPAGSSLFRDFILELQ